MRSIRALGIICLTVFVSQTSFGAKMDADNSDYGFNGFTSEAFVAPTCIDLLSTTCLLSEQVFVSPSLRDNGVVVYDFKVNQDISNFVLTLTVNNGFQILDPSFTGNIGAFQLDPRGFPGVDFDANYQPCPPGSSPGDVCNPVQFGPNALGLATPGQPNGHTATFTVPASGLGFVFYVALDESSLLSDEVTALDASTAPDPLLSLDLANVSADIQSQSSAVPEPGSWSTALGGLAAIVVFGRRRLSRLL